MGWDNVGASPCSVARTLSVIGDRWTMLIVRELFLHTRRFDELLARTGMSSNLLTQRLNRLVDEGVLTRRKYQDRPTRFEYRLTAAGLDLYPVIIALKQWGDRWRGGARRALPKLRHRECNKMMSPMVTLSCPACGEAIGPRDVQVVKRSPPVTSRGVLRKKRTHHRR